MNQNVNGPRYLRKWPPSFDGYRQEQSPLSPGELDECTYIRAVELAVKYPRIDDLLDSLVGRTR